MKSPLRPIVLVISIPFHQCGAAAGTDSGSSVALRTTGAHVRSTSTASFGTGEHVFTANSYAAQSTEGQRAVALYAADHSAAEFAFASACAAATRNPAQVFEPEITHLSVEPARRTSSLRAVNLGFL